MGEEGLSGEELCSPTCGLLTVSPGAGQAAGLLAFCLQGAWSSGFQSLWPVALQHSGGLRLPGELHAQEGGGEDGWLAG